MPQTFTSWKTISALSRFRVAKYKQRRQIQTRFTHLENVQIGGCTGLTFGWLQSHRSSPEKPPSGRIEGLNHDRSWIQIDYLAGVFNSTRADSYADRVGKIAPHALGAGTVVMEATSARDATFAEAIRHLDNNPGHHAIIMALGGVDTSHVIAAFQGDGHLIVFDPNSGEYRIGNTQRVAFFQAMVRQYATYVSGTGRKIALTINSWEMCALGQQRARR